jgi:hypothetical protein
MRPGALFLFRYREVLIADSAERIGRLQDGLHFGVCRILPVRDQPQQSLGLAARFLRRPGRPVRANREEPLPSKYSVLEDVGYLIALASLPKPRTAPL